MTNTCDYSRYKEALIAMLNKALAGEIEEPEVGLCRNMQLYLGTEDCTKSMYYVVQTYRFVRLNCKDWEHFSGDDSLPVPHEPGVPLWEGTQLEYRLSLVAHLIHKIDGGEAIYDD